MSQRSEVAARMAEAAHGLLSLLDGPQRQAAVWPFPAEDERTTWFYTPTEHGGLSLHAMTAAQHQRTHRLVATGLSHAGYVTMAAIMGLENILDHTENFDSPIDLIRDRGRDPMMYWIAIFGEPSESGTWGWRFGGHHISLNFTIINGEVVGTTPLFFGADPAAAPLLGPHLHRPLAGAEDLGRELVRSLRDDQLATALVSAVAPSDLITANRSTLTNGDRLIPLPDIWRGRLEEQLGTLMARAQQRANEQLGFTAAHGEALAFTTKPKGLAAAELAADQREVLVALLDTYLQRVPDGIADQEKARVLGSLDQLYFVWAGSRKAGEPHYYRLQSQDLLVEYDNTARNANHIHAVWRDLRLDFGGDALADHYARSDHSH